MCPFVVNDIRVRRGSSPVSVQVHHRHVVSKGGGQARALQGELRGQTGGPLTLLPQQDHGPGVMGPGGPSHNGHPRALGDGVARVQGES